MPLDSLYTAVSKQFCNIFIAISILILYHFVHTNAYVIHPLETKTPEIENTKKQDKISTPETSKITKDNEEEEEKDPYKLNLLIQNIQDSFKYGTPEEISKLLTKMIKWNIPFDVPKNIFTLINQELSSLFQSKQWTILNSLLQLVREQNITTLEQECLQLLQRKKDQLRLFEQELLYTLIKLKTKTAVKPLLKKFYEYDLEIASNNLHLYATFFEQQKNQQYAKYISEKIEKNFRITESLNKSTSIPINSQDQLPDTTTSLFIESLGRIKYTPASKILRTLLLYGTDSKWNLPKIKFEKITSSLPEDIKLSQPMQLYIIRSLGKIQDLASTPIIHFILDQYLNAKPDFKKAQFSIYIACIDFLSETRDKKFSSMVLEALRDSSPVVRKHIIKTLENSSNKEAIPYLIHRLEKDPEYSIRLQTIKTLISILVYHSPNSLQSNIDPSIPPLIESLLSNFIINPKKEVPSNLLEKISKSIYNLILFDAIFTRMEQDIHPRNYISKQQQKSIVNILKNMIKQYHQLKITIDQRIFTIANKLYNNPFSRHSKQGLQSIIDHSKIINADTKKKK